MQTTHFQPPASSCCRTAASPHSQRRTVFTARRRWNYPMASERRYVPDLPPVFSQSAMSPITIDLSIDLHMS